jgi:polyhydroxybutyrate depolymerase
MITGFMRVNSRLIRAMHLLLLPAILWTQVAVGDDSSLGRHAMKVDGLERHFVLRIPDSLTKNSKPVPLVIVLHGGGGNAGNAEAMTGFTAKAKREGFIVVYPDGTGRFGDKLLTWNARHCCGYAMKQGVDDVGFVRALIDKLSGEYPIDPRRIYATGMSNGAMMSHRLGIELSDRLAAIAPVVGGLFGDEAKPGHAVSVITFNGLLDQSVPLQGGQSAGRGAAAWDGAPLQPASEQGAFWGRADKCDAAPETPDKGAYTFTRYRCPAGVAVEQYVVKDNGHAWPGGRAGSAMGDVPGTALNATDVMWQFFRDHPRAAQ